jgi:hypothetical protein
MLLTSTCIGALGMSRGRDFWWETVMVGANVLPVQEVCVPYGREVATFGWEKVMSGGRCYCPSFGKFTRSRLWWGNVVTMTVDHSQNYSSYIYYIYLVHRDVHSVHVEQS